METLAIKQFEPQRKHGSSKRAIRLFSTKRTMSYALILLIVVAGATVYGITQNIRQPELAQHGIIWYACGSLVSLAIVLLLLGKYMVQRSLLAIEQQLTTLAREGRLEALNAPIPDEFKPVMTALGGYVDQVRDKMENLRLQKKELDLQIRFADTERRNTEAIIFSISDAVLVMDSFGDLVLANTAAEKLFEFRLSDCRQRPIERALSDRSLVTLLKEAKRQNVRRQLEYSAHRDNRVQTYIITLSTVMDTEGEHRGVVAVFHDITRERELAQIKADFVSSVSHELRTPLSSIKAYVEMLLDDEANDPHEAENFLRIIDGETDRLQRLINNILCISRIESGVEDVHQEVVQPGRIITEVLETIAPQANEKHIHIKQELDDALPSIMADRDMLYQAVMNLVSNAIKYTQERGTICVQTTVDREAGYYVMTVIDNGMGIKAHELQRIFDKFYRSREATGVARGTGLGLPLVKHIVETIHRGEISITSEQGAGTTVVLRFPLAWGSNKRNNYGT
jgi:two-component system phosphate regulon sensor histidine kinase PhoR